MSKLTKHAYAQLVEEDIAWLITNNKRCIERDHIELVLRNSVNYLYQQPDVAAAIRSGAAVYPGMWRDIQDGMNTMTSDEVVDMAGDLQK